MRVFSTFSGISAASIAWKPLGWDIVAYAEPAPFPAAVLHHRLGATAPIYRPAGPDFTDKKYRGIEGGTIPNFGDVAQITDEDLAALGDIDVLEGGPPCQGFSLAGLRGGLSDPRGNLTLSFVNLALRMRRINNLRYVVMENVHGFLSHKDNPLGCFMGAIAGDEDPLLPPRDGWSDAGHVLAEDGSSAAWRILDSVHFGVAQSRRRLYIVVSFDPDRDAGEVLFEREGEGWTPPARGEERQDPVPGCDGSPRLRALIGRDSKFSFMEDPEYAYPLMASDEKDQQVIIYSIQNSGRLGKQGGTGISEANAPMYTVLADHWHGVIHKDGHTWIARKLMPCEEESLQGFPMGWTDVPFQGGEAPNTRRYHACGNSVSTPVYSFLAHRILLQESDIIPWE